jgi:hypothetical protein
MNARHGQFPLLCAEYWHTNGIDQRIASCIKCFIAGNLTIGYVLGDIREHRIRLPLCVANK